MLCSAPVRERRFQAPVLTFRSDISLRPQQFGVSSEPQEDRNKSNSSCRPSAGLYWGLLIFPSSSTRPKARGFVLRVRHDTSDVHLADRSQ